MFKDLLLNIDNIEIVINDYFKERCSEYKVELNINKSKENNKVYDVNFDGKYLFLSVFINKKGKITLKVKEGKEQEEKEKLAQYIVDSSKCKIDKNNKNKNVSFKALDIDDFENVINLIKEEECSKLCELEIEDSCKITYKIEGRYRDILTITYYKTTKTVCLQGLPLEVFNYTVSYFNELLDLGESIDSMNKAYSKNIQINSLEEKYISIMKHSYNKHTEKLKKSLMKSIYNLDIDNQSQGLTYTELIFEPLRALEGHIIMTLSKDYGIIKPYKSNLSMFTYDGETDIVNFRKPEYEEKIKEKNNKIKYYKRAYKHIIKYRHRYFHWSWNEELAMDTTLHLDNIDVAKDIILDTLHLIDEYYE